MVSKQFFNPWDSVKVGSSEIVSHNYKRCQISKIYFLV